uniref:phosphatidylserine decarboxylase n=1 Tax=Panagrellus redivivus TaxID=6233 RepID=A0A7E4UTK1_PANRE
MRLLTVGHSKVLFQTFKVCRDVVRQQSTQNGPPLAQTVVPPVKRFRKTKMIGMVAAGGIVVGTATFLGRIFLSEYRSEVDPKHYYSDWKIRLYTSLPLAATSRCFGYVANVTIPVFLRETLFGTFASMYNCRLDEAIVSDLKSYPSLASFFNRALKTETRPISAVSLVAPADGIVLHYGEVVDRKIEYVKGHDYDVTEFLGPSVPHVKTGNALYQIVVYLAPGDYHAFHSPADWKVNEKVHHPGFLLSVKPSILDWIPRLFCLNERIVLSGAWKHGFFSMSAVAATNVGDINIPLGSAEKEVMKTETHAVFSEDYSYFRGDKVGEFRLGSTIVLIFEAPKTLKFAVQAGDKLRYGQSLIIKDF